MSPAPIQPKVPSLIPTQSRPSLPATSPIILSDGESTQGVESCGRILGSRRCTGDPEQTAVVPIQIFPDESSAIAMTGGRGVVVSTGPRIVTNSASCGFSRNTAPLLQPSQNLPEESSVTQLSRPFRSGAACVTDITLPMLRSISYRNSCVRDCVHTDKLMSAARDSTTIFDPPGNNVFPLYKRLYVYPSYL